MNTLTINDNRTLVTSVYIDKSSSSAGGNSIYYSTLAFDSKTQFQTQKKLRNIWVSPKKSVPL